MESWIFRNRFANFIGGERHYHVLGTITFKFDHCCMLESGLTQLAESIREVDRMFPWHDDPHPDTQFKSICYLNGFTHSFRRSDVVWFHITPGVNNLRKAQVYAYEKYLTKLAEELAKKKLPSVTEVCSTIEINAETISFQTR